MFVVASRFAVLLPLLTLVRVDLRGAGVMAMNLAQVSEFSLVIVAPEGTCSVTPPSRPGTGRLRIRPLAKVPRAMTPQGTLREALKQPEV